MDTARYTVSTDDELLAAVADGDRIAFSELYDRLAPRVFGHAHDRVGDLLAAEDITREVFLDFWRRAPRLDRGDGSVAAWLCTTQLRRGSSEAPESASATGF